MTTTTRRLAALLLGGLLFLTACSARGGGSDDASGASAGDTEQDALALESAPEGGGSGAGESAAADGRAPSSVDLAVAAEDRQIISTATISMTVEELDPAVARVQALVDDLGGLIYAEDTDLRGGALTHLTIKVPPTAFRDTLTQLADLGEVETQTVSTDDVTAQVVDLDSRIATAEASVLRLRALLDRAERIADITTIESQLLQRETDLETLRGQRRTIERQVALATVDVTLSAERTSPPPPAENDNQTGFSDGLHGGADALRTFAIGLSAVVGALLPWTPVLLLGALVTWWVTRRKPTPSDR